MNWRLFVRFKPFGEFASGINLSGEPVNHGEACTRMDALSLGIAWGSPPWMRPRHRCRRRDAARPRGASRRYSGVWRAVRGAQRALEVGLCNFSSRWSFRRLFHRATARQYDSRDRHAASYRQRNGHSVCVGYIAQCVEHRRAGLT